MLLPSMPDVAPLLTELDLATALVPVVDLRFEVDGGELSFFSVVSTIGTPIDVTAQELRLEAFFPSDDLTRALEPRYPWLFTRPVRGRRCRRVAADRWSGVRRRTEASWRR